MNIITPLLSSFYEHPILFHLVFEAKGIHIMLNLNFPNPCVLSRLLCFNTMSILFDMPIRMLNTPHITTHVLLY